MRLICASLLAFAVGAGTPATASAAVTVAASADRPTLVAELLADHSYTVTVSGIADLFWQFNGGAGLKFAADGTPAYTFPGVYAAFAGNGMVDPTSGRHAQAYQFNFGALVGSYVSLPSSAAISTDFFALSDGTVLRPLVDVSLYGLVNDSAYGDNAGGYQITINEAPPVPEPATWGMMLVGFGMLGYVLRRNVGEKTTRATA